MGRLIGRALLDTPSGNKLNSLLTVGTPHKGSALAYPVWANGNVMNDNLIEKIAVTLYLKRCGGITSDKAIIHDNIPSIQNLLPVEPFLQKIKSNFIYLPSLENSNNWLTSNPFSNPWEINVGMIAGTGYSTLKTIQTKDAAMGNLKKGEWIDGKIVGKIMSTDGDGTVLVDSALLPQANYTATINQSHRELVTSTEGMAKILEFLGEPIVQPINSIITTTQIEPNSALIVIGHLSSFVITDQKGKSKTDKDGIISLINPESGLYTLKLFPKSENSLLIVAQFLPNGDVKYKEYYLKGLAPIIKILKLNLQKPQDDILFP
jgi:hypothetical protein